MIYIVWCQDASDHLWIDSVWFIQPKADARHETLTESFSCAGLRAKGWTAFITTYIPEDADTVRITAVPPK